MSSKPKTVKRTGDQLLANSLGRKKLKAAVSKEPQAHALMHYAMRSMAFKQIGVPVAGGIAPGVVNGPEGADAKQLLRLVLMGRFICD